MIKKHVGALVVFLLVSMLFFIRSIYFDDFLSSDQNFFQLVYLGKVHSAFSDYRVPALDHYVPFQITNFLRQFIEDPIWVYRSLLPVLTFAYLASFYWMLYKATSNKWISIIVSLISLVPHTALGSQYWGIWGSGYATHRAFLQPFIPLIFFGVFQFKSHFKKLVLIFLAFGLASSMYPTQAFYLVVILLITLLAIQKVTPKNFLKILGYGMAFSIGTLPYILPNLSVGLNIDPLSPELIDRFNEALRHRFSYTFYPASLYTYTRSIILDSFVLITLYGFLNKQMKEKLDEKEKEILKFSNIFLVTTLAVTFGLPLIQDGISLFFGTRLFIFDQFGESKFVYLGLYLGVGLLFKVLYEKVARPKWQKILTVGVLSALIVTMNFFMLGGVIAKIYPLETSPLAGDSFNSLCQWIKGNTKEEEVLMTEEFSLRLCTERHLWVTWKEGMVYLYAKPAEAFVEWYERLIKQENLYKESDLKGLIGLAQDEGIQHLIVDRTQWGSPIFYEEEKQRANVVFENEGYTVFYIP